MLSEFGIIVSGNGEQRADCPKCSHLHPNGQKKTLSVNVDKKVWKCFRCGYAGGVPDVKYNKIEAEQKNPTKTIYDFFEKRGISAKVVNDFNIKYEIKTIEGKAKKVIAFNYYIGNDIVNIKYRTSDKNFLQSKNGKRTFYNFNGLYQDYIIICEGEIDVLTFAEIGLNAISIPSATTNIDYFNEVLNLFKNKKIYIAIDKDEAGKKVENQIINLMGIENVFIIDFIECKDANEFLLEYGKDELLMQFEIAEPYPDEDIKKATDYYDVFNELIEKGYPTGFKTGWYQFDNYISWYLKRVCVVTGVPGSGKSTFCDELILRLCLKNNLKSIIFSSENGEREIHLERFLTQYYGKTLKEISKSEGEQFLEILDNHFSFIEIDNPSIEVIFEKFKQQSRHTKNDILVIDPYNTLEHKRNKDLSLTEYVGDFLNKCLLFARENNVLIFIVAHPKKLQKQKNGFIEPSLYDISDSAHWYNKAEYGLIVHRFEDGRSKIIRAKIKNKYMGSTGFGIYSFKRETEQFYTDINDVEVKYL